MVRLLTGERPGGSEPLRVALWIDGKQIDAPGPTAVFAEPAVWTSPLHRTYVFVADDQLVGPIHEGWRVARLVNTPRTAEGSRQRGGLAFERPAACRRRRRSSFGRIYTAGSREF